MSDLPTVLITGASSGIGAVYADRFARRGHPVILVARDQARLDEVAARLCQQTCATVEVLRADLTHPTERARVERRLESDDRIEVLVNNAGMSAPGEFAALPEESLVQLLALNVTAPTALTHAIVPRLVHAGSGALITVGSMVGFLPEYGQVVYGASKAYLLYLSQSLHHELRPHGVYVQAVLPAATRTGIFARTGRDTDTIPGIMEVEDMVDAALAGYDRKEPVTMPSLPDAAQWSNFETARSTMASSAAQGEPAARYLSSRSG